jgi:ElaB/YqjD/DUF883 family membrane-anchored ribosome-binding protein
MPPRNPELPEGTDHIINGALETGEGSGAATGGGGGASTGFIGGGEAPVGGDDTGGTAVAERPSGQASGQGGKVVNQLKENAASLRDQATTKAREFADDGKTRATEALEEFSRVVEDAAGSIDERLGEEYGRYARRAATTIADFAETLRNKEVDELYEGAANIVRKSPAVAIGVAAAVGFGIVRLIKSGLPEEEVEVEFTPEPTTTTTGGGSAGGTSAGA